MDFSSNPPVGTANSAVGTWEGCSSITDANGNLLFYTNGLNIWNQSNALMANGSGLMGGNASSQSALIVKQPGNPGIYFVFTTNGASSGLRYSVVDMNLAAGMGSVTAKNLVLSSSSTEKLCGTRHCNGTDIWVISHDANSDVFRANLLTAAGINTTGVLSWVGSTILGKDSKGCIKVSPHGKKLAMALHGSNRFELFDFDPASGIVTNSLVLPVSSSAYGCEFSPDGTKLYGSLWDASSVPFKMRQWDLCAGSNDAIAASVTAIDATRTGQLQLGPDGKIYQARATHRRRRVSPEMSIEEVVGENALGVIHNPNASAANLNFNNTGQALGFGRSMLGLPNFVSGYYKTPVAQFTYSDNPSASCIKIFFTAPPLVNATCSATSYTINSVQWMFGDPASGPLNVSTLINPDHIYPSTGTYDVRLVLYNDCGGVIDTLRQTVVVGGALINSVTDLSLCAGSSLTLSAAGASSSYSWSTGASSNSIVVSPPVNTTYSLSYMDTFGCLRTSVHTITVHPLPAVNVSTNNPVCAGLTVPLKASGAITYSWSTGVTNSTISVTPSVTTQYTVTGTSLNGCSVSKVATVEINAAPVPVIVGDTVVCAGSQATVMAIDVGNATYSWNNGTPGNTLVVVPRKEQWIFSVTAKYNNGCSRWERVRFNILPLPKVSVAGNTVACGGGLLTHTASGATSYTWHNGQTTHTAAVGPFYDTYSSYTVSGTGTNNCVGTTTVWVNVKAVFLSAVSASVAICEGNGTYLSAIGGEQYEWAPTETVLEAGSNTVIVMPTVTTVYTVTITDSLYCSLKTVEVLVHPKPALWAGPDTTFSVNDPKFITARGEGTVSWIAGLDIACPNCSLTQIFPTQRTCYIAQVVDTLGCMATDDVCIDVGFDFALYVPNVFTPNGDGLNDLLLPVGYGISEVKMTIYNRWGEQLFSSGSIKEGWNGDYAGKPCEQGVYIWFVDFVSADGKQQRAKGHVLLQR